MTADEARELTQISINETVQFETKETLRKIEEACKLCQYETHTAKLHEKTIENLTALGFDVAYNKYREEYDISWALKEEVKT